MSSGQLDAIRDKMLWTFFVEHLALLKKVANETVSNESATGQAEREWSAGRVSRLRWRDLAFALLTEVFDATNICRPK